MCSEDFTKLRQKVSLVTRGGFGADNIKSGIAMLIREAIIEANYAIASVTSALIDLHEHKLLAQILIINIRFCTYGKAKQRTATDSL
ncbi:hypothetical protein QQP08_013816 [Theobroma cacao]|nr:hypothetical protein QQP08_013530 [Theobroma cacao]WRX21329.1 hypothetical protein QQP08_013816 [Theobroma cacao]